MVCDAEIENVKNYISISSLSMKIYGKKAIVLNIEIIHLNY